MNEVNRLNTAETLGETGEAIGGYLDAIEEGLMKIVKRLN